MYKVIFIDGGEGGKRVERLTNIIRDEISKEELTIHRSCSRFVSGHQHHSLQGFDIAFIHNSDNLNDRLEPVFTIDALEHGVPLVLYSGGIRGFKILNPDICEINDTLLETHVTQFLKYRLLYPDRAVDFNYLFPGEMYMLFENLLEIRENIILNYEKKFIDEVNTGIELYSNTLRKYNNKILPGEMNMTDEFDIKSILGFLNKSILKFENMIKPNGSM